MNSDKLLIPLAIIIAGLLIGGGFYLSKGRGPANRGDQVVEEAMQKSSTIDPLDANEHLLGNPDARIIIVEYSDTECPFCKEFHKTLRAIMTEYGNKGDVAWVYRHFPIAELHSKAPKEAEALECAAELGGNSKFWEYTNRIYEVTPSNNNLPPIELTNIAKQVGLNSESFNTCLESGRHAAKVQNETKDAFDAGAEGTPFTVIVDTKTSDTYPLNGLVNYTFLKNSVIEVLLQS